MRESAQKFPKLTLRHHLAAGTLQQAFSDEQSSPPPSLPSPSTDAQCSLYVPNSDFRPCLSLSCFLSQTGSFLRAGMGSPLSGYPPSSSFGKEYFEWRKGTLMRGDAQRQASLGPAPVGLGYIPGCHQGRGRHT